VLAATNLAAPAEQRMRVATNSFDMDGNFTVTSGINPEMPQRFCRLQLR
jgi:hypothetical protein